jgi:hypothetical protein
MYLAAMAYNLKKYLRTPQQLTRLALAVSLPSHLFWSSVLFCNSHANYRTLYDAPFGAYFQALTLKHGSQTTALSV